MAVQKIQAGAGIREIAANKSLVALWVKNAERLSDGPAFVEVITPRALPTTQPTMPADASWEGDTSCKISVGIATIEIPQGYPTDHLVEILRAVSATQLYLQPAISEFIWSRGLEISEKDWMGSPLVSRTVSSSIPIPARFTCFGPGALIV